MIYNAEKKRNEEYSNDFSSVFTAPEVNLGEISYKNDIYSIGQIIYYIMKEKYPNDKENYIIDANPKMQKIYKLCTEYDIKKRPNISELMFLYSSFFSSQIISVIIQNDQDVRYIQGLKDFDGEYIKLDINKSINIYNYASDQNDADSQFSLGVLYYENKYIARDINKSIHYLLLASNQNDPNAQYSLGILFSEGKFVTKDIN